MLLQPTCLIVGAGAGCDYGMPLGDQLKDRIHDALAGQFNTRNSSSPIWYCLASLSRPSKYHQGEIRASDLEEACHAIARGLPQSISIDNFIHSRQSMAISLCGKLGIINSILAAESQSTISKYTYNGEVEFRHIESDWIKQLWKILTENLQTRELNEIFNNLYIINFNYDRVIEHYLFNSLMASYGIDAKRASNIMSRLQIIHPYGMVAPLPWQDPTGVPFGQIPPGHQMFEMIGNIKTFTEGLKEESDEKLIEKFLKICDRYVFLGFGFHFLNMKLLNIKRPTVVNYSIYGTAHGESASNVQDFIEKVTECFKTGNKYTFVHNDLDCSSLLKHYRTKFSGYSAQKIQDTAGA